MYSQLINQQHCLDKVEKRLTKDRYVAQKRFRVMKCGEREEKFAVIPVQEMQPNTMSDERGMNGLQLPFSSRLSGFGRNK